MEDIARLAELDVEKWKTGHTHCLYLPGICIHACPAFPGSNEDLHYQPVDFAPGTTIAPLPEIKFWETHPALRPTRSTTLQPRRYTPQAPGGISPLASLPAEVWENPAFRNSFMEAALSAQPGRPHPSSPKMLTSSRPKSAGPGMLSLEAPKKSPSQGSPDLAASPGDPESSKGATRGPSSPGSQNFRPNPPGGYKPVKPLLHGVSTASQPPGSPAIHPSGGLRFAESAAPRASPSAPAMKARAQLTNNPQAFENTSTSVAASQMRNALNNLADTVTDPTEKKVCLESEILHYT